MTLAGADVGRGGDRSRRRRRVAGAGEAGARTTPPDPRGRAPRPAPAAAAAGSQAHPADACRSHRDGTSRPGGPQGRADRRPACEVGTRGPTRSRLRGDAECAPRSPSGKDRGRGEQRRGGSAVGGSARRPISPARAGRIASSSSDKRGSRGDQQQSAFVQAHVREALGCRPPSRPGASVRRDHRPWAALGCRR